MYCKSYKLCKSEAIILLMSCYPFLVLPFIHLSTGMLADD